MPKIVTDVEIVQRLKELDNGVEYIGPDPNGKTKSHRFFKCSCGNVWSAHLTKITKEGQRCSVCMSTHRRIEPDVANVKLSGRGIKVTRRIKGSKAEFECGHGHTWVANFNSVYSGSTGCPHCSQKAMKTRQEVADQLAENNIALLSSEYTGVKKKHDFKCLNCGHEWRVTLEHVLNNGNCTRCSRYGRKAFDKDSECWLYYLAVQTDNRTYYKIGVTKHQDVLSRYRKSEHNRIRVLDKLYYSRGQDAYEHEQQLLRDYAEHRYQGPPILKSGGSTELFYTDVLGLDKSNQDTQPKAS